LIAFVDSKANDVDVVVVVVDLIAVVPVVDAGIVVVAAAVVVEESVDVEVVFVETLLINLIAGHELHCNLRLWNSDLLMAFSMFIYN